MNTLEFLSAVLADEGEYCLFTLNADSKTGPRARFYDSLLDLKDMADKEEERHRAIFIALSTFTDPDEGRTAYNAKLTKCFFLDIDCGEGKPYATQEEGYEAVKKICKAFKLPSPLVISSGRGLHVYWILDKGYPSNEWKQVADIWKSKCKELGVEMDYAVPADAARVLRIVGYHHRKGEPLLVKRIGDNQLEPLTLEEFAKRINGGMMPVPAKTFVPLAISSGNNAVLDLLAHNKKAKFKTIITRTSAGDGCGQLAYLIMNQKVVEEPLWRAGLSIAAHCVDGEKAIHLISKDHADYDPEDTAAKADRIKGPYLCDRFDEYNPGGCDGCVHRGKIKSPIVLGQETSLVEADVEVEAAPDESGMPATVTIPKFPRPYARGERGGIYLRTKDADGNEDSKLIYQNDIYVTNLVHDTVNGTNVVIKFHPPKNAAREFAIPLSALTSPDKCREALSEKGVGMLDYKPMMGYLMTWYNDLQSKITEGIAHRQFGWTEEHDGFIMGDRILRPNAEPEPNYESAATASYMPLFKKRGTIEGWKEAISFFDRDGMLPQRLAIGWSFGSILMEFMDVHSVVRHMYSTDTGFGKTTISHAMLSAWGDPERFVNNAGDTQNVRMHRAEIMHSFPFVIDEMSNEGGATLSDIVYQFSTGMQKNRMRSSSNGERHRGLPWSMSVVTTANESIMDRISAAKNTPKAEQARVLEVEVAAYRHPVTGEPIDKAEADDFKRLMKENCGLVGEVFAQYVLDNLEAVKKMLYEWQVQIDKKFKLSAQNRFWSAGAVTALVALWILNKLGLVNWDMQELIAHQQMEIDLAKRGADYIDDTSDAISIIARFWADNIGNQLIIKSTETAHSNGLDQHLTPEQAPRGTLVARLETDTKLMFIRVDAFRKWCADHHINYTSFRTQCKTELGATARKMRLGKGTHLDVGSVNTIVIDSTKLNIED